MIVAPVVFFSIVSAVGRFTNLSELGKIGGKVFTARFLTDYLQGDVYFKCKKPDHNLLRTRAQTALARDISKKLPLMHEELNLMLKN